MYSGLAMAAHHLVMRDEAASHLERAAYYSRQARDHLFWHYGPVYLAMARVEMGQTDVALAELRQLFMDLAVEPYEEALLATLELTPHALEDHHREAGCFYLAELEALVTSAPMSGEDGTAQDAGESLHAAQLWPWTSFSASPTIVSTVACGTPTRTVTSWRSGRA